MKISLERILSAFMLTALFAMLLIIFISFLQSRRVDENTHAVLHKEAVFATIHNMERNLSELQTIYHGVIIFGKDSLLTSLNRPTEEIIRQITRMDSLLSDKSSPSFLADSIRVYFDNWMAIMKGQVKFRQEKGMAALHGRMDFFYSDKELESIRRMEDRIMERETNSLEAIINNNTRISHALGLMVYVVLGVGFICSLLIISRVRRTVILQKELEKKFTGLLNAAPDATVIVNRKGQIEMVNQQAEILFGYDRKEILGKEVEMLIPLDLREIHQQHRDHFVMAAKTRRMGEGLELHALKKNGQRFPVEISLSPLEIPGGLLITAAIRDLTRRKEEAEKNRRMEQQYHLMVEEVEDYAILMLDSQGYILNWNKGAEKIKKYKSEEIIGKSFTTFYTRQDLESNLPQRLLKEASDCGKAIHEGWRLRKDGIRFWGRVVITALHNGSGELVGFTKVTHDLTDRKKADEIIQKQKEDIQDFMDSMSTLCAKVETSGKFMLVNKPFMIAAGQSREELMGSHFLSLGLWNYSEEILSRITMGFEKACLGIPGNYEGDFFLHGSIRAYNLSLIPIKDKNGRVDYIIAEGKDITFLKEVEKQLLKKSEELETVNRELEAFTYSVSHDLRAPLRGIIGFTAILEEDYTNRLDEEARRITGIIRNNTIRMGMLIDDLLAFSRMGKQEILKTQIDTRGMVEEILSEIQQQPGSNLSVGWVFKELLPMKADRNTIRQVWINLISNAIKYSSKNPHPRIEIGSYTKDGEYIYYVQDNGVGFDVKYIDKLFKVFQRLHAAEDFEGTGVGLALVHKIVSRHGGRVWAKAKEGEGACFSFTLPI